MSDGKELCQLVGAEARGLLHLSPGGKICRAAECGNHGVAVGRHSAASRLIALGPSERDAPRIWDVIAIRRELAARGLDLPADVLQPRSELKPRPDQRPLDVTWDAGNLMESRR